MTGFLTTILILLLVYYFLKILAKYFAPQLFKYAAKKAESHFKEKFGNFSNQQSTQQRNDGDVIIDDAPTRKANPSKKVGDYIDFEEIE